MNSDDGSKSDPKVVSSKGTSDPSTQKVDALVPPRPEKGVGSPSELFAPVGTEGALPIVEGALPVREAPTQTAWNLPYDPGGMPSGPATTPRSAKEGTGSPQDAIEEPSKPATSAPMSQTSTWEKDPSEPQGESQTRWAKGESSEPADASGTKPSKSEEKALGLPQVGWEDLPETVLVPEPAKRLVDIPLAKPASFWKEPPAPQGSWSDPEGADEMPWPGLAVPPSVPPSLSGPPPLLREEASRPSLGKASGDRSLPVSLKDALRVPSVKTPRGPRPPEAEPLRDAPRLTPAPGPQARSNREPGEILASFESDRPILLFPVRLETRFVLIGEEKCLRVRIYPDEILADSHEIGLTPREREDGDRFWHELSATVSGGPDRTQRAQEGWRRLVASYKAPRAAWIVRNTDPARTGLDATRTGSWTRAVQAWMLPDAWEVRAERSYDHSGNPSNSQHRTTSRPVLMPLALTLTPPPAGSLSTPGVSRSATDEELFDAGSRWTVDFEHAEACGMAVTFRGLTAIDWELGFDQVQVIGVRSHASPEDASVELARLLDVQHYSRGLAFVPQGTPTNNTAQRPAGFPPADEGDADSFRVERPADGIETLRVVRPADRSRLLGEPYLTDGAKVARYLGVEPSVFARIEGQDRGEQAAAADMNLALWPATLGYFLSQILEPTVVPEMVWSAREHFIRHVRGRGPLPALRVGAVPYGILPVTSLTRWAVPATDKFQVALLGLLREGRRLVRVARATDGWTANLPHVGRMPDDPDRDLLEILGADASLRELRVREALGRDTTLLALGLVPGMNPAIVELLLRAYHARAEAGVRLPLGRLATLVFDERALRYTGALVSGDPRSEQAPDEAARRASEIGQILGATAETLRAPTPSGSLLAALLRHATLLEMVRVGDEALALKEAGRAGLSDAQRRLRAVHREIEVVEDPADPASARTPWARLRSLPGGLGAFRLDPDARDDDWTGAALRPYAQALERINRCAPAEQQRLLSETLDLSSHRLDAWVTSLVTRRLEEARADGVTGLYLGAYGWVEKLRRRDPHRPASEGFVHGPSLDHAATGAVLLNAHLTHRGESAERFRINLSSARVRRAEEVLEALRSGQMLAAVLGYQVERSLHDLGLDVCIEPLRERFPITAVRPTDAGATSEEAGARHVLDGLALHAACVASGTGTVGLLEIRSVETQRRLDSVCEELVQTLDAVGDLLTAESVFQLVRGNPGGAGATLDALGRGARPPDPEVVRSPRGGIPVTHRVMLRVPVGLTPGEGWPTELSPRAHLAPGLDGWVGRLLGDPRPIVFPVSYVPRGGSRTTEEIGLAELGLRPLDFLALAHEQPAGLSDEVAPARPAAGASRGVPTTPPPLGTELERRIAMHVPEGATDLVIRFETAGSRWRSFAELLEFARALNAVLGGARAVDAPDVLLPERAPTVQSDHVPPSGVRNIGAAITDVLGLCEELSKALAMRSTDRLLPLLAVAANHDLPGALCDGPGDAKPAILARGRRVLDQLRGRLLQAAAVSSPETSGRTPRAGESLASIAAAAHEAARGAPGAVLEALFGRKRLVLGVLPRLSLVSASGRTRESPPSENPIDLGVVPREARRWLQQFWRVRAALGRWRRLSLYARAAGLDLGTMEVAQLEPSPYGHWAAVKAPLVSGPADAPPAHDLPPPGCISLFMFTANEAGAAESWSGVLLDEWTEFIPNRREMTGLAFHYDDPGAEAPQALLLAVPPVPGSPWTTDALFDILTETREMAKIRAVDRDGLGSLGQLLPGLYLANNPLADTVSTRLAGLAAIDPESSEETR